MKKPSEVELTKIIWNCKQATFLIEKRQVGKITLQEKLELQWHLKGCDACTTFIKQSALINQFVKDLFQPEKSESQLEEEFKKGLQKHINELLDEKKKQSGESGIELTF